MRLIRLDQSEHGKTRELWEEVFREDTKAFLDYYYFIKARENEIYTVEEDGKIVSMLHLNPYKVRINGKEFQSFYIVAVATRKEYRSRGFMGALLGTALNEMYDRKVPFAFLMPAAEAIYTPYDFRFVYSQNVGKCPEDFREEEDGIVCSDAGIWDAEEMAQFFHSHFEDRWQIYASRDDGYYRTMIFEQQSENGGVRLLRRDGKIVGMYAYAREEETEIREPLLLPGTEKAFVRDVNRVKSGEKAPVVFACPEEMAERKKPVIMARLLSVKEFLEAVQVPEESVVSCSFAVLDPIVTKNSKIWKIESGIGESRLHVRESEDSDGVLPVAELTELLFGQKTPAEIRKNENVILSDRLEEEFGKLSVLNSVFLNEIV